MKSVRFVSILIIVLILGGYFTVRSLTINIPMGKVGVRIQQYGLFGQKGIIEEDFGPGWHRDLGFIDNWALYDSTVQTLEMTKEKGRGSSTGRDDVKIQSADGYSISLDVTVKYRIQEGKAHKLVKDTGKGNKYKVTVRARAEQACMTFFGRMKTEDFYNPFKKRETAEDVKSFLREDLAKNFIEIIDVLIRNVEFNIEYERKIRRKKLADQEVELNKSLAAAETMRGKTQVIEAETRKLVSIVLKEKDAALIRMQATADLSIAKIEAGYKKYATEKGADADLIAAEKMAEGTRLVKKAEAEGERLRNQAMSGPGGKVMVALEAAKNLRISHATISTIDTDLLDVRAMAERLGLGKER